MASPAAAGEDGSPVAYRRIETVLRVAGEYRTGVAVRDLGALLPADPESAAPGVGDLLEGRRELGSIIDGIAFAPGAEVFRNDLEARRARGLRYWAEAQDLLARDLRPVASLLECLGVTGSTAYGEPEAGDDCDFLAVTRSGALWTFLTFAFLAVRRRAWRGTELAVPTWCFNYVLDAAAAAEEFRVRRGFLFAREALMVRPLYGGEYYRGLLAGATWLADEAPRLYAQWAGGPTAAPRSDARAPWSIRALSVALFPWMAAYLQLLGLLRNHRLRRAGRETEAFRVTTGLRRLSIETEKFDRLRRIYAAVSAEPARSVREVAAREAARANVEGDRTGGDRHGLSQNLKLSRPD
jgi:hypothetical protein